MSSPWASYGPAHEGLSSLTGFKSRPYLAHTGSGGLPNRPSQEAHMSSPWASYGPAHEGLSSLTGFKSRPYLAHTGS